MFIIINHNGDLQQLISNTLLMLSQHHSCPFHCDTEAGNILLILFTIPALSVFVDGDRDSFILGHSPYQINPKQEIKREELIKLEINSNYITFMPHS